MSGLLTFCYSELSCGQVQSQRGVPGKYSKAREEISKMIVSSLFSLFLFISSLMRLQSFFKRRLKYGGTPIAMFFYFLKLIIKEKSFLHRSHLFTLRYNL